MGVKNAKIGGQYRKNDPRDLRNWVESLELKATTEGEQFHNAAIYRAMIGWDDEHSERLREAIVESAQQCLKDHREQEKRTGVQARIQ